MLLSDFTTICSVMLPLIFFVFFCVEDVTAGHLTKQPHNLTCYHCSSLTDGDSCRYIDSSTTANHSCKPNQMFCSVVLFQYSTDSSEYLFYSVQRHCDETCQDGCSTVGERIKLFLCRSCCNGYLCNDGNSGERTASLENHYFFLIISIAMYKYFLLSKSFEMNI